MDRLRPLAALALVLSGPALATAEVVGIDVRLRDDAGTHERVIARVHFAVDPLAPANRDVVDLTLAPRTSAGRVEFSSDLLLFVPKDPERARGTVFLEIVNRGRDQSLGLLSDAVQRDLSPAAWSLGDRFLLQQGFTVAFLGWQFDVETGQGLTFEAPVAPVRGVVRADYIETGMGPRYRGYRIAYCARDPDQSDARLTFRTAMDAPPAVLPRDTWRFSEDGCAVLLPDERLPGLYEAVYDAEGSPVAGLGLAAVRDFASYLKHGADLGTDDPIRTRPAAFQRVLGFGYSQSARFLRVFLRDGFNRDVEGRAAFDGLFIASAGAGGGSFNHRFAMPGQAGNSVLSILRPVDLPPFTDEGLLARARADGVVPRILTTVTSTEYWARSASLTHTTDDGAGAAPLDPSARLYFLTGQPHAAGPLPPIRRTGQQRFQHDVNFAEQKWVLRALLEALDEWVTSGLDPPPSRYPRRAQGELVDRSDLALPVVPAFPRPDYLPPVWRMDFGPMFPTSGVISREPPGLGPEFRVLVPQVDGDGNELGGVPLPEVAVPLGTYTGWNLTDPPLTDLRYLAGLFGSFVPFARTEAERRATGDSRSSIAERYESRDDYLRQMRQATDALVRARFVRADDVPGVLAYAGAIWDAVAGP